MQSKKKDHLAPPGDNNAAIDLKVPKYKPVSKSVAFDFPIVGIGASSVGLKALEPFFSNMPQGNCMAFVFIQDLTKYHVSRNRTTQNIKT